MYGVFLDTETNGLDWSCHDILEIALEIRDLGSGKVLSSYTSFIQMSPSDWKKSSPKSLAFTGISFEEVVQGKTKAVIQKEILTLFKKHTIRRGKAVFICQNPSFDRIFFSKLITVDLQEKHLLPYNWLDLASMHWSKEIQRGAPPKSLQLSKDKIADIYKLPEEAKPHRALQGVKHLVLCYEKVVGFPLNR